MLHSFRVNYTLQKIRKTLEQEYEQVCIKLMRSFIKVSASFENNNKSVYTIRMY